MKQTPYRALSSLALLCLASSCLSSETREVTFMGGLERYKLAGESIDPIFLAGAELSFKEEHSTVEGNLGVTVSYGTEGDVDGSGIDLDVRSIGLNTGARWTPEDWDFKIHPFIGGGVQWMHFDVTASGGGSSASSSTSEIGLYWDLGVGMGNWDARVRIRNLGDGDFAGLDVGSLKTTSLLIGYRMAF